MLNRSVKILNPNPGDAGETSQKRAAKMVSRGYAAWGDGGLVLTAKTRQLHLPPKPQKGFVTMASPNPTGLWDWEFTDRYKAWPTAPLDARKSNRDWKNQLPHARPTQCRDNHEGNAAPARIESYVIVRHTDL